MQIFEKFVFELNDFLWGFFMIVLLCGTHIYMTFKTGFIQKKTFYAIRLSFKEEEGQAGDVSPFQSLACALASTLGTGNIIGVGTAVFLGGPGAVFWCWICGVLGIATKYAESLIAVKYREKAADGSMRGGAMYVLKNRLGYRRLAAMFAVFCTLASLGVGCGVQINAISVCLKTNAPFLNISPWAVGMFFAAAAAIVIVGGIKSIGRVCEKLIPAMTGLFFICNIIILALNYDCILPAVKMILYTAFKESSIKGGLVGGGIACALRYGVARGLFSNESGMGSAPIVASAAKCENPVRQALVASTGTFWDTVVLMAVTGVVIVSSVMKNPDIAAGSVENGAQLTAKAFSEVPYMGGFVMVFGIITFAFSTVLGWEYYGERCFEYLFNGRFTGVYKLLFIFVILIAPLAKVDFIWTLSDILNALMALPNLIAVIMLSDEIKNDTKKYFNSLTLKRRSDRIKKK